jgi:hypothetical protein
MRSTVTIDKDRLDELVYETKARSKASAVNEAISVYLKQKRIDRIMAMKGKLEFDLSAEEIRNHER